MLEKQLVTSVRAFIKLLEFLVHKAIGDLALGLKGLAICALGASFYFLMTYGTHHSFAWFVFLATGLGLSLGLMIGGVDLVWTFIRAPHS